MVILDSIEKTTAVTTYPVAEQFHSVQGEGLYCGVYMAFIRLAGCTVGRPYNPATRAMLGLNVYQERCTSWDGKSFSCDTNYKMSEKLTVEQLVKFTGNVPHVCITGGEPLMHDLTELLEALWLADKFVHIETSGTIDFTPYQMMANDRGARIWITVSPKHKYIPDMLEADEIKILVGNDFDELKFVDAFVPMILSDDYLVWIQPINGENDLNRANIDRCLALQKKYPHLRLSLQLHKVLGVR